MSGRSTSFSRFFGAVALLAGIASNSAYLLFAEDFDWRNVGGKNFVSPVKSQFYGTCWAHGNIACLEAKYKLTRNDPVFNLDLSEENLVVETSPHDMGSTLGGGPYQYSFEYFYLHGIVLESELPGIGDEFNGTHPSATGQWPLSAGWENRVVKTVYGSYANAFAQQGTQAVKNALKMYGPLSANLGVDNDWWPNPGAQGGAHTILIVGFHDDASVPGGGYWIVKNSWGEYSSEFGAGYSAIPYAKRPYIYSDANAITGAAYYTGAFASATWSGGSGAWQSGSSTKWSGYAWENKETNATFGGTGGTVTVSGTVIAHGLTIGSGAAYTFTGGAITVTAGGITANESVTIDSPLTIGGPQTWTVASGKTLTVNGALHTIISDTTVSGAGNAVIAGAIDGGGTINTLGAKPGGLIKSNSGSLTLTGASNYGGDVTINAGTLSLNPAGNATYSGGFYGSGALSVNSPGIVSIGGGSSNFSGTINVLDGTLQFVPAAGVTGTFSGVISGSRPIVQNGEGATRFTAANNYTGVTTIAAGALQANHGTGLPSGSFLSLNGGVLQSNSAVTFSRSLGTSGGTFQWDAGGGGFSAGAGTMTVQVNGGTAPLAWGTTVGSQIVGTLKLSSATAAALTNFQNGIDLGGATRTIQVEDNPNSTADYAQISGTITGTGASTIKKTGTGKLLLSTTNSYAGDTIISGGALQATIGAGIPNNSFISLDGGVYQSNGLYTFNRSLGTSGNAFQWTANGGGFAAGSSALTVNIGNGAALTWGSTVGSQIVGILKLGSTTATSSTTFQNNINLGGGDRTIHVDDNPGSSNDSAILSGAISGTGNLIKTGLGKLTLSGSSANSYTGTTTILGGDLDLNKSSGPAIPGNLVLGGVTSYKVRLMAANQIPATATITWNSSDNVGLQELLLMGRNLTVAGITDLIAHGVIANTSNESGYSGTFTLTVNNTADCTYSGILRNNNGGSGTLALAKTGSGTLTLAGGGSDDNIRYTGGTTVSGGTLVFRDILYCPIVSRSVTLSNNASLVIDSAADFSGVIGGAGTLTKKGNGTLTLSGSTGNSYSGITYLQGGNLSLNKTAGYAVPGDIVFMSASSTYWLYLQADNQIAPTATATWNSGSGAWRVLQLQGHAQTLAGISSTIGTYSVIQNTQGETGVGNSTLTINNSANCAYNGVIRDSVGGSGTLALVKTGTGTLTLTGTTVGQYTGGLTVNNGTLDYSGGTLPACNYTINGGTLNIGTQTKTIAGFKIVGGAVSGTTGMLTSTTAYDVQAGTVSARLGGTSIALNKTGEGSAVLSGANSYTGATTVSGGVLQANSGAGLPFSSYLKLDGGILQGYGSIAVSFLRVLSSTAAANNFQWTAAGGGFAAGPAVLTVRIGGNLNPVNWGDAAGANIAGALKLNSTTSANVVDFQNGIYLNGKIRTIFVEDNPASAWDFAAITGPIADGSGVGGILKTGPGTLALSGALTYTGNTVIDGGILQINSPTATLSTIAGTGKLGIGSGANLTAASINIDSLYIGTTPAGAAVPEPSALVLMLGAVVAGFAFWKKNA